MPYPSHRGHRPVQPRTAEDPKWALLKTPNCPKCGEEITWEYTIDHGVWTLKFGCHEDELREELSDMEHQMLPQFHAEGWMNRGLYEQAKTKYGE